MSEKTCKACGHRLVGSQRLWCCKSCRGWNYRNPGVFRVPQQSVKLTAPNRRYVCGGCGIKFFSKTGLQPGCSKYCSNDCRIKLERATYGKIASQKRRSVKIGAYVEMVDSRFVANRDDWKCHLCGKKISQSVKYPHRMSLSMDHIVPLSMGGLHSLSNVKAAHLVCNQSKGDRPAGEQLMLVGSV